MIMDGVMQPEMPEAVARLQEISGHHNLAEVLTKERLALLAHEVLSEYRLDKHSMSEWFDRMENGLNLAKMVKQDKNTPWVGASNVKFPLVTSAALQFNARAYPAIVPGGNPVIHKVYGNDATGEKAARGKRVSDFMSWQLTGEVDEWETETDSLLTILPLIGTCLRKVYYDDAMKRVCVKLCEAGAVIVNDKVKSLDAAPRISEEIKLYPYEIEERKRAKRFLDVDVNVAADDDSDAPQMFVEQHRRIDLDGDGYPEPYVVTVHAETSKVVRVVANFEVEDIRYDGQILAVDRRDHYAVYHFLPSMDGGFWGTGLGLLLGDISESINTLINMMIDSGHMSSLGAGLIGAKDFRMKGGAARFRPNEYKQVSAYGSDIRNAFVQLDFPQPSPVLFQMLGLLIEAGREIASVKDVMTGEAPRNQTATTTLAMIEQGMMVFTAAYKRIYRALAKEFKMISRINAETVDMETYSNFHDIRDEQGNLMPIKPDFDFALHDMDIAPIADPRVVTSMQAMGRAQLLMEMGAAGSVDLAESTRRALSVAQVEDVEKLMPKPNPMDGEMMQHQQFMMQMERGKAEVEVALLMAQIEEKQANAAKDLADVETDRMKLALDQAQGRLGALMELAKNDAGSLGRMAGPSRNEPPVGQPVQGNAAAQSAPLGAILGGGGDIGLGEGEGLGG